jgi:hypothetical protein
MKVSIILGANAYAVIDEGNRKTDILLSHGKSPEASLREYADEQRKRAARILEQADLAEKAAQQLENDKIKRNQHATR